MKRILVITAVLLLGTLLGAQNRVDIQGRKTGPWKAEYPEGQTRYEGTFHEGRPVGTMTRYYENGKKQAILEYAPIGNRIAALLFHDNGKKAGKGIYLGRQKDSLWSYYSRADESLRMTEYYVEGLLHGSSLRYYTSGSLLEEVHFEEGLKEGPWMQYFEDGSTRLSAFYRGGLLHGEYRVWYTEDQLMMKGIYMNDRSDGIWDYYDEKGELLYSLEYKDGIPVDQEKYRELMEKNLLVPDSLAPKESDVIF